MVIGHGRADAGCRLARWVSLWPSVICSPSFIRLGVSVGGSLDGFGANDLRLEGGHGAAVAAQQWWRVARR